MEQTRVTIQEAATKLHLTESAIRKRIKKGQIASERDPDGRVYVYLTEPEFAPDEIPHHSYPLLLARLESEVEFLRVEIERKDQQLERKDEQLQRKDHLLAAALERIPALEQAPPQDSSEERESSAADSEEDKKGQAPPDPRPWYIRWFR